MADETLSLRAEFQDIDKLIAEIQSAASAVLNLGDSASAATAGFEQLSNAAANAGAAIQGVSGQFQLDPAPIEAVSGAADNAAETIKHLAEEARKAKEETDNLGKEGSSKIAALEHAFKLLPPAVQAFAGAFVGLGVFKAIEEGISILKEAVGAFETAEDATTQLAIALGSLGKFSDESLEGIRSFARELRDTTRFSDEAIISTAALIAQVGRLSGAPLERATEAAVQLSSVLGRDLNRSALLIAKAAQGSTAQLARFGIVMDETIPKGKKFEALLALIEKRFGGTAQLQARTLSGTIAQLKVSWEDFLEAVLSGLVVFEPTLRAMVTQTKEFINTLERLGLVVKPVTDTNTALENFVHTVKEVNQEAKLSGRSLEQMFSPGVQKVDGFARDAKRRLDQAFSDLKFNVDFTIRGGDPKQIKKLAKDLEGELHIQPVFESDQFRDLLKRVREAGPIKVQTDTAESIAQVNELAKFIESRKPKFQVLLDDHDLRVRMTQLEIFRPNILAKIDIDAKELVAIDKVKAEVKLLPRLDDDEFTASIDKIIETFDKKFVEGFVNGNEAAKESALALLPVLKEVSRQAGIRMKTAAAKDEAKKLRDELDALQKIVPIEFVTNAGEVADSQLPKILGIIHEVQSAVGIPLEFQFESEDLIREAGTATSAAGEMQQAIDLALQHRDLSSLDAISDSIRTFLASASNVDPTAAQFNASLRSMLIEVDRAKAAFAPLKEARVIQARIEVLLDQGRVEEAKGELARLKQLLVEFPELRLAINLEDVEGSFLAIDQIRQQFDQAMQGVDAAIQITTSLITSGFQNAADQILNIFVSLFADILRKLIASKILSFLTRFASGPASIPLLGSFFFKPTGAIPPTPEPVPTQPPGAPKVTLDPIRIPAPDVAVEPLRVPAPPIKVASPPVTVLDPVVVLPAALRVPAQEVDVAAALVTVQDPFLILPDPLEIPGQQILLGQTSVEVPPPALILPQALEIPAPTVDVTRASLTIPAPEVVLPDPLVIPAPAVDVLAASVTVEKPKIVQGDAISVDGPQITVQAPAPLIVPPPPTRIEAPTIRVAAIADRFKLPRLELPEFDIPTIPVDITLPELPALRARIAALPTVFDEPIAIQQPRELLPVVQFARFAEREAAAARTVVLPAPSPRPEPESILRRRTAPEVQVTFAGNFDGESVRRQLQSGSMNREFNRMARRGRL